MGPQPHQLPRAIFGPFEYDGGLGEIRKHGKRLKLTGQPLRILEMLLERPGEAVSRAAPVYRNSAGPWLSFHRRRTERFLPASSGDGGTSSE